MRFVRDKLIERLIVINKGKLCTKIKDLRSRHKVSLIIDTKLITTSENGWECLSTTGTEMYTIQEINKMCTCQVICSDCNICIHRYYRSCIDSAIKFNMCKHIHLLVTWIKQETTHNNELEETIDNDEDGLFLHESQTDNTESQAILEQLSKSKRIISMEQEKINIERRLETHIDSIQSPTKLEVVKNVLAPLSPSLN